MPLGLGKTKISASCQNLDISKFFVPPRHHWLDENRRSNPKAVSSLVTPAALPAQEESWVMLKEAVRENLVCN